MVQALGADLGGGEVSSPHRAQELSRRWVAPVVRDFQRTMRSALVNRVGTCALVVVSECTERVERERYIYMHIFMYIYIIYVSACIYI